MKAPPDAESGPGQARSPEVAYHDHLDGKRTAHEIRREDEACDLEQRHEATCEMLREMHGDNFIDFVEDTQTVVLRRQPPPDPPPVAVVPVVPRDVFVDARDWYGSPRAEREPLELVAVVILSDGSLRQLVLDNGAPQLLDDDGELAHEQVPAWCDARGAA